MTHVSRPRHLLTTVGPYTLAVMAAINVAAVFVWTALFIRSIPPHAPITGSAQLFVAAFPGIIVLFLVDSICLGFWMEYVTYARGERLRRELVEDREKRDAAIAQAVAERLRQRGQ